MFGTIFLIDGYNVIHRGAKSHDDVNESSLPRHRLKLIQYCADWLEKRKDAVEFIIYFDGKPGLVECKESRPGIKVVYTADEIADDRIASRVAKRLRQEVFTVVSDDRAVVRSAKNGGCAYMGVQEFLAVLHHGKGRKNQTTRASGEEKALPSNARKITEDLERVWCDKSNR